MRTTFDIKTELIEEVLNLSGASSKKEALVIALESYIRNSRRNSLRQRIDTKKNPNFSLTLEELEKLRER